MPIPLKLVKILQNYRRKIPINNLNVLNKVIEKTKMLTPDEEKKIKDRINNEIMIANKETGLNLEIPGWFHSLTKNQKNAVIEQLGRLNENWDTMPRGTTKEDMKKRLYDQYGPFNYNYIKSQ